MERVSNFNVNPSGDDKAPQVAKAAKRAQPFKPDSSVSDQPAWQTGMLHAKQAPNSNQSAELAAIDMPSLSPAQLENFQKRIENAIIRQEHSMLRAVNMFAGNDATLRPVVSSMLLAT